MPFSMEAQLPSRGFGSEPWFDQVFSFEREFRRVREVMARFGETVGVPVALDWMRRQTRSFLTEFGVGDRALVVQPLTRYTIRDEERGIGVYGHRLNAFGELLEEYLDFDEQPEAIREGLRRAFTSLREADPGEGVVILSPTELYADYDSRGNVLNPMVVVDRSQDGVEVVGWFLFLDRELTDLERVSLLALHAHGLIRPGDSGFDLDEASWFAAFERSEDGRAGIPFAERLVQTPARFVFPASVAELRQLPQYPTAPYELDTTYSVLAGYLQRLDALFEERFGRRLWDFEVAGERHLRERIEHLVAENIQGLMGLLLRQDKRSFLTTLWRLVSLGQRSWAKASGRDSDEYLTALQMGRIRVVGFHPVTGLPIEDGGGMSSASESCEPDGRKRCAVHGEYEGESCPTCKNA